MCQSRRGGLLEGETKPLSLSLSCSVTDTTAETMQNTPDADVTNTLVFTEAFDKCDHGVVKHKKHTYNGKNGSMVMTDGSKSS